MNLHNEAADSVVLVSSFVHDVRLALWLTPVFCLLLCASASPVFLIPGLATKHRSSFLYLFEPRLGGEENSA